MFLFICSTSLLLTECFMIRNNKNININNYFKQQNNFIIPSYQHYHYHDKYYCYHDNFRLYAKKIAPNQGESMDQYRKVYIYILYNITN